MKVPVGFKHEQVLRCGVVLEKGRCRKVLEILDGAKLDRRRIKLLYLVITGDWVDCVDQALEKGIQILKTPQDLLSQKPLDFIMEMTGDAEVLALLARDKPRSVGLVDYNAAQLLIDVFRREEPAADKRDSEISLVSCFASALLEASPDAVMVIDRNYRSMLAAVPNTSVLSARMRDTTGFLTPGAGFTAAHPATRPKTSNATDTNDRVDVFIRISFSRVGSVGRACRRGPGRPSRQGMLSQSFGGVKVKPRHRRGFARGGRLRFFRWAVAS